MTRIETIKLTRFRNNEHFQFMTDVDELVTTHQASVLGIDVLYVDFRKVFMAEDTAIRIELGSAKSKTIEQLNKLRGNTWKAVAIKVKATLLCPIASEVKSAEVIQRVIDKYGDVRVLTYVEETASITNLTNDLLLSENTEHLKKIGILIWVTELKSENEQFSTVFNERNSELAVRESGDVRAVRNLIDPLYDQLVETINSSIVMKMAQPAAFIFVNELNEKIKYYTTIIASRKGRSKAEEKIKEKV
jgi:hypothetical protein